MTGFWLVSIIVLWIVVIGLSLIILALAKEVEVLHNRVDSSRRFIGISANGEIVNKKQTASQQEEMKSVEGI